MVAIIAPVLVFLLHRLSCEVMILRNCFIFFLVCVFLVVPVCATDFSAEVLYQEEPLYDTVDDPDLSEIDESTYLETEAQLFAIENSEDMFSDSGISTMSINPITPDDSTGLKSVLLEILGDYDAIIVEYTNGNYTSREVFQDDVWICSFWLLAIMVYCLFKLLGGWLVRKQ